MSDNSFYGIKGKQIYLRAMEREDMPLYQNMMNDSHISQEVVGWGPLVSSFQQNSWYESAVNDRHSQRFTIALCEDDMAVGTIILSDIDWQRRSAVHSIKLHRDCPKHKGIGTDALLTSMKYAFDEMNLHRLETTQIDYNKASLGLYEKCGWKREGVLRKAVYRNGSYHDVIMTSILEDEYRELDNGR